MASGKEIKNRIKSVKNTKKITKAMELVAASKMKRAVFSAMSSRLYAGYSWDILSSVVKNGDVIKHYLFGYKEKKEIKNDEEESKNNEENKTEKVLMIMITSNRGLCGAYNSQILKKISSFARNGKNNEKKVEVDFITAGKKGDVSIRRVGQKVIASFFDLPDNISLRDIAPLTELALNEYKKGNYDRVLVGYTDFVSALSQKPKIKQVVPVTKDELVSMIESIGEERDKVLLKNENEKNNANEYLFEGDKNEFLGNLAEKLVKMQIYQMFLESNASEQSSRMMAMKNASEAAGEMISDLTLVFNKARQSGITREISEISAGMASVS